MLNFFSFQLAIRVVIVDIDGINELKFVLNIAHFVEMTIGECKT